MTVATPPVLHLPDEPTARAEAWLDAVHGGTEFESVLIGPDGIASWLWSRWRSLSGAGLDEAGLGAVVLDYRREMWLWLAGERTWQQSCSGLIGRISRRLAAATEG
jgi:hypothetical protein